MQKQKKIHIQNDCNPPYYLENDSKGDSFLYMVFKIGILLMI